MKNDNMQKLDNSDSEFKALISLLGNEIATAQVKVIAAANAQMLLHYWKMGTFIFICQQQLGWGAKVISKISAVIRQKYPEKKGYSSRNLTYMCQFAKLYPAKILTEMKANEAEMNSANIQTVISITNKFNDLEITQELPAQNEMLSLITQEFPAQLENLFLSSPLTRTNWASHQVLMDSKLPLGIRFWYVLACPNYGWSSNVLDMQIKSGLFQRQIKENKNSNFSRTLPTPQSDLANYLLKDPYIFDITNSQQIMNERNIETQLVTHITDYLLEMGNGFSFVAKQKHFEIGGEDFYADLILYNIQLHAYVVVELKARPFEPGDVSQLNFYINVVNDKLKGIGDNDTIGLVLCQGKNKILADYVLKGYNQPIGVSDYQLSKAIPDNLKSTLPSIEEVESELGQLLQEQNNERES